MSEGSHDPLIDRYEALAEACRAGGADLEDVFFEDNDLLEAWWEPEHLENVATLRQHIATTTACERLVPDRRVAPHLMAFFRHSICPLLCKDDDVAALEYVFVSSLVNSIASRVYRMPDEDEDVEHEEHICVDRTKRAKVE